MKDKKTLGKIGEDLAEQFLRQKGWTCVARNYRYKRGEIDLIMMHNEWLIFVEVKWRSSVLFGFPESFVDEKKKQKILETAAQYLEETAWQKPVRYDVVSILYQNGKHHIEHFEDVIG